MESGINVRYNSRWARKLWAGITPMALIALRQVSERYKFSVLLGDVLFLSGRWYVTNVGLLHLARRKSCSGIRVERVPELCDLKTSKWVFKATVYTHQACRGFVGYGDADPSNVSPLVRSAEMRVAETRAVNRALRKAYGIGICSVEELGSIEPRIPCAQPKKAAQPVNGNSAKPKLRDRLCQIIRQHQFDPNLVKSFATDFCGVKTLREATREQIEDFVTQLADRAEKDPCALMCQLNSYRAAKEGAA